jgi:chromatin assembly factor 1 subunit B
LVSGGDGGELLLWQPSDASSTAADTWKRTSLLRGHTDDVMDLDWSADGTAILSGSIDNKAIVWEVSDKRRGQMLTQFANHKHFVQGVAWDPVQQYVATQRRARSFTAPRP